MYFLSKPTDEMYLSHYFLFLKTTICLFLYEYGKWLIVASPSIFVGKWFVNLFVVSLTF